MAVFIDLDDFEVIDGTMGHPVGDAHAAPGSAQRHAGSLPRSYGRALRREQFGLLVSGLAARRRLPLPVARAIAQRAR